ncbi:MAG TPA: hypothetical protein DIW61_02885 [Candidatus Aminicenantes bacterium]|nr:hypothetical protein [Candidatus Aminicenantes bacterium]
MKTKILIVAILLALIIILLVQNTQEVVFRVYFWKISMSQVILVPLAVLVGFLFGYFVAKLGKERKS